MVYFNHRKDDTRCTNEKTKALLEKEKLSKGKNDDLRKKKSSEKTGC